MSVDIITKEVTEAEPQRAAATADRRRPGRPARVSSALIALLRRRSNADVLQIEDVDAENPLRVVQALMFGRAAELGQLDLDDPEPSRLERSVPPRSRPGRDTGAAVWPVRNYAEPGTFLQE